MAKAQGLPLSFIVIAAISALVLVIVVAFTIGGLGSTLKQIGTAGATSDLSAIQTACRSSCVSLQATAANVEQAQNSDYCRKSYSVDLNGNGKIETGEVGVRCWTYKTTIGTQKFSAPIGVDCVKDFPDGKSFQEIQSKDVKSSPTATGPFTCDSSKLGTKRTLP